MYNKIVVYSHNEILFSAVKRNKLLMNAATLSTTVGETTGYLHSKE